MKKLIIVVVMLLAGCGQSINNNTMAESNKLCADNGGLRVVRIFGNDIDAYCNNDRWFNFRRLK